MNKGLKQLLNELEQEGWSWTNTNSGHVRLTHNSGVIVFCSWSASDHRALKNIRADTRRALALGYVRGNNRR